MYVIVAGAGLIGQQVARLLAQNKHNVVVIDIDRDVCRAIHSETGVMAIHGNATDMSTLERAGARKADILLCLMHHAADNTACALVAKSLGVTRIIGRLRHAQYEEAYRPAGIQTIVRMSDVLADQIMVEIEQPRVRKVISLQGGKAEIHAVTIPPKARSIGMTIRDIADQKGFPKDCVLVGIYREATGDYIIPRGDAVLQENAIVFVVSKDNTVEGAAEVMTRRKGLFR